MYKLFIINISGLIKINKTFLKCLKIFGQLSHLVTYLFPIFITIIGLIFPCKPPLLGSMVNKLDDNCDLYYYNSFCLSMKTVMIAILEFLIAKQGTICGLHYAIYCLLIAIVYLTVKSNNLNGGKGAVLSFREVQVLEKVVNDNIRDRLLPVTICVIPVVQIFAGFVIVKLEGEGKEWLKVGMFALVYSEVLVFNLVSVSSAAVVHNVTGRWLEGRRSRLARFWGIRGCGKKTMRRYWKSCLALRLYFWSNYVDRLTPLIVQQFCVVQTMSLILLSR